MIVTLLNDKLMSSISLPEKTKGKYLIEADRKIYASIEGEGDNWILRPTREYKITGDTVDASNKCILCEKKVYPLKSSDPNESIVLYTEPITEDRVSFTKYKVGKDTIITIGRADDNEIIVDNVHISRHHAVVAYDGREWIVQDADSSNGTYVNGKRVISQKLYPGDMIYILGVMIIIGSDFFSINNPGQSVTFKGNMFQKYDTPVYISSSDEAYEEDIDVINFYCSPRLKRDVEKAVFKIDAPPNNQNQDETPLMLTLGPSLTMGMASMMTAIIGITNGNYLSAITSGCMLCGTVVWPFVTKKIERRKKRNREKLRQEKYQEYLEHIESSFDKECKKQKEILDENYIEISRCKDRIMTVSRNLWERSLNQNDLLKLRVGTGEVKLVADIQYPERRFEMDRDELEERLLEICERPHTIKNGPIVVSFYDNIITGIVGNNQLLHGFVNGIILQLAAMYSYDEIKMVFLCDEADEDFAYVKWLPHIWNDDKSVRFLAKNKDDVKLISAYFETIIDARKEMRDVDLEDVEPYYVIFSFSKELEKRADFLKKIYEEKKNLHISVISIGTEIKYLPKECGNVIEITGVNGRIYDKNDSSTNIVDFQPDIYVNDGMEMISTWLANIHLDTGTSAYKLPKMITFLEMFSVGSIEHLNILERWRENDPTQSLAAQIGVDEIGDAFKLDLHEKQQGPHGLVAGMTGSGKSEFILTYILSMAINYHPNEVAFVLIDYKGGGMAKTFEKLPHTAGIITNLDGSAINRSLISIDSELKRRQGIFAQLGKSSGISNIDIYKYQKMYREGKVNEPLQHLFIIADEFAELKTQQPEFMAQLVSAARIGRSLGVHLILATQKPSGVVDDQIWSNSRFRACLKVQDKSDSMDMLKRPEAAELKETGRFYLQVGYNEMFSLGQSAWSGAPYYPQERYEKYVDDSVEVIDDVGQVMSGVRPNKHRMISNPQKQVDAITEYLSEIAMQEKIEIRHLWLDPIPEKIYLDELEKKYSYSVSPHLEAVIGEYDDPAKQKQDLLTVKFGSTGNIAVYGMQGSGKTTFLSTIFCSLMRHYSPEELNIYILDFSAETLVAFSKAPHVGDVVLAQDNEKVVNLIKLLLSQIQIRKKKLADYDGDITNYNRSCADRIPYIVVAIHNYSAFSELYDEYDNEILRITREGIKYGIHFLFTAMAPGAIRFRLQQNISQSFVLQLTDETDYSTILGKTEGVLPEKKKGRGLFKEDAVYEFQTATPINGNNQLADIREFCEQQRRKYPNVHVPGIPVLPELVNEEFVEQYITRNAGEFPVGVETATLALSYFPFRKNYISFVQAAGENYKHFMNTLLYMYTKWCDDEVIVFDPQKLMSESIKAKYLTSKSDIASEVEKIFDVVLDRNNSIKDAENAHQEIPVYSPITCVFCSYPAVKEQLDDVQIEKLQLILEKGKTGLNVFVILADSTRNIAGYSFEKWFKTNVIPNEGIWVGNGITGQYYLKTNNTIPDMSQEISDTYGFVVKNGKPAMVKLLAEAEETDD